MARIKVGVRILAGADVAFERDIVDGEGGCVIRLSACPKSSREGLDVAEPGLTLKIRAPPVDGQANTRILEVLAFLLDTAKRSLSIESGDSARQKRIAVDGLDAATVRARIRAHHAG